MVKAGGHWSSKLIVPEQVRASAGGPSSSQFPDDGPKSFTWLIEIASQILFSNSASVNYELLVGRDEKSVEFGFHSLSSNRQGVPGRLEDHQGGRARESFQRAGIFSKAVRLKVDDTENLWNTPTFPSWDDAKPENAQKSPTASPNHDRVNQSATVGPARRRKRVHLVILTHGLHSNLGADMLYVKESIDAAAKQARIDSRERKAAAKAEAQKRQDLGVDATQKQRSKSTPEAAIAPTADTLNDESEEEDEQVIVRGFSGNAVRTERGIQYLGKRLAKYTLSITYPDQPYLPVKSTISKTLARSFTISKTTSNDHQPSHKHSTVQKDEEHTHGDIGYKITSISFIGHSLGGLVQTYAIAYIQKHSPEFFDRIKPVNFVGLATPWLGLSNENPIYVKFALDFGLVGRTGQDLGLTWRPPTLVRSGWGAMIGGLGKEAQNATHEPDPASKPLLRVLPSGPAHAALARFRNRTVYSNVVNDGIVPLRTSCLLFLDWRGLGRVEKARREMGLVGTMVGWGWNEMVGANASSPRPKWAEIFSDSGEESEGRNTPMNQEHDEEVPQPEATATTDDIARNTARVDEPEAHQFLNGRSLQSEDVENAKNFDLTKQGSPGPFAGLWSLFKPASPSKSHPHPQKKNKIYRRGQTMRLQANEHGVSTAETENSDQPARVRPVRGASLYNNDDQEDVEAPPKTTVFESAGDLLNPPLPPKEFFLDPSARPRTIFHDRVYHPEDIPLPPAKKRSGLGPRSISRDSVSADNKSGKTERQESGDSLAGSMKIEEKIARAYHKDMSWRKILVRLEPDAHNNMIVRRMFANAYGWPVIKHMVDTHFAYTDAALTEDALEAGTERAAPADAPVGTNGENVINQSEPPQAHEVTERPKSAGNESSSANLTPQQTHASLRSRTESEVRELRDDVPELKSSLNTAESSYSSVGRSSVTINGKLSRQDSAVWSDRFFGGSDDDSDLEMGQDGSIGASPPRVRQDANEEIGTSEAEIAEFLGKNPLEERSLRTPGQPRPLSLARQDVPAEYEDDASPALHNPTASTLGLQASPKESVFMPQKDEPIMGISEQVAFAQAKKAEGRESGQV
ncbi:MAG: hypothetical protein Q9160_008605 [Pyrenula sp. 1 TL-2023]